MKKILTIVALTMTFNTQASLLCDVAEKGIEYASEKITTSFKCESPETILEDLRAITKIEERCSSEDLYNSSSILTCKILAKSAAYVLADKIPTEWECDAEQSQETIGNIIFKACQVISKR
ncbi:hypothetical protein A9Q84_09565 [Halobacteriovorax marinus]|uniref:Uncharacterized protein n=1 Tax=Halobacteriovorax marinus TaxID=97084 RepID=A0A1Y5F708_9BACT|nr:hypothetical protein A9Q84_09565 [Halobacteriovorax marinus]